MKWIHVLLDERTADKLTEALELAEKSHAKYETAQSRLAAYLSQVRLAKKAVNTINFDKVSASQLVVPWTRGGKIIAQLDKDLRLNLNVKEVN